MAGTWESGIGLRRETTGKMAHTQWKTCGAHCGNTPEHGSGCTLGSNEKMSEVRLNDKGQEDTVSRKSRWSAAEGSEEAEAPGLKRSWLSQLGRCLAKAKVLPQSSLPGEHGQVGVRTSLREPRSHPDPYTAREKRASTPCGHTWYCTGAQEGDK